MLLDKSPNSFQIAGDPNCADQFSQVRSHGRAARDGGDGDILDFALKCIEMRVHGDDLICEHGVGVGKRVHRLNDHLLRDAAHFRNAAPDSIELLVIRFDSMIDHGPRSPQPKVTVDANPLLVARLTSVRQVIPRGVRPCELKTKNRALSGTLDATLSYARAVLAYSANSRLRFALVKYTRRPFRQAPRGCKSWAKRRF